MSLRSVLQRAREEPPRAFLTARRLADEGRINKGNQLSPLQMSRRLEPLLGLVADGTIPVDEHLGPALGIAVQKMWEEQSRADSSD